MKHVQPLFFVITFYTFLFCVANDISAQPPEWLWAKSSEGSSHEIPNAIATDDEGNAYVTGQYLGTTATFGDITLTKKGKGDNALFVVKYSYDGSVLWAKSAGSEISVTGNIISVDEQGITTVIGLFRDSVLVFGADTLFNNDRSTDIFIVQYSPDGDPFSARSIAGSAITALTTDSYGSIYTTGSIINDSLVTDIATIKYDAEGNLLWARMPKGTDVDISNNIITDTDGNIYISGFFRSDTLVFGLDTLINTDSLSDDNFLVKYDPNGNVLWATTIVPHRPGTKKLNLATDSDNNLYVSGEFGGTKFVLGNETIVNAGSLDVFLTKYSFDGSVLWVRSIGSSGRDEADALIVSPDGIIYTAGAYNAEYITIGDTTFYNSGQTKTSDIFLAYYFPDGKLVFKGSARGDISEEVTAMVARKWGDVYITGTYYSTTFILGDFTLNNSKPAAMDMFTAHFSSVPLSVEETGETNAVSISLFPNPAKKSFRLSGSSEGSITVYALSGEIIHQSSLITAQEGIDLSGSAAGTYLYHITNKGKVLKTGKLVLD